MTAKKTPTIKAAALATAMVVGSAVAPAQVVPPLGTSDSATIVVVDEDGRIAAPIVVAELEPSDGDQVSSPGTNVYKCNDGCKPS